MSFFNIGRSAACALATGCVIAAASPTAAQSLEERFAGKQIKILFGSSAGGGYDLFARTIATPGHVSRHRSAVQRA